MNRPRKLVLVSFAAMLIAIGVWDRWYPHSDSLIKAATILCRFMILLSSYLLWKAIEKRRASNAIVIASSMLVLLALSLIVPRDLIVGGALLLGFTFFSCSIFEYTFPRFIALCAAGASLIGLLMIFSEPLDSSVRSFFEFGIVVCCLPAVFWYYHRRDEILESVEKSTD